MKRKIVIKVLTAICPEAEGFLQRYWKDQQRACAIQVVAFFVTLLTEFYLFISFGPPSMMLTVMSLIATFALFIGIHLYSPFCYSKAEQEELETWKKVRSDLIHFPSFLMAYEAAENRPICEKDWQIILLKKNCRELFKHTLCEIRRNRMTLEHRNDLGLGLPTA